MNVPEIRANVQQPRVAWLSSKDYTDSNTFLKLKDQIEDIVESFHKYTDADECEHFIRGKHGHPQYEQVFLIVTIEWIDALLERGIHDVRVLQAIFIFNPDSLKCSNTFKEYSKVSRKSFIGMILLWFDLDHRCLFGSNGTSRGTFCQCRYIFRRIRHSHIHIERM